MLHIHLEYKDLQDTYFQLQFIKPNFDKKLKCLIIVYMTEIWGLFEKGKHTQVALKQERIKNLKEEYNS